MKLSHRLLKTVIRNKLETGDCELEWAPGYAEPGYDEPESGILFANWNPQSFGDFNTGKGRVESFCSRLGALIEKAEAGYALEWSDEWTTCCDCGKAVRTSPDSYSWAPSYMLVNECEPVCHDCLDPNTIEDEIKNNPDRCDVCDINWEERGWVKFNGDFETGFHPGQDDDPREVFKTIRNKHTGVDVLFQLSGVGQFDATWVAFYKDFEDEQ